MKLSNKFFSAIFFLSFFIFQLSFSQEALNSSEENYYEFLALQGFVERPTINYRTLSDSQWNLENLNGHIWENNNLGTTFTLFEAQQPTENFYTKGIKQGIFLRLYPLEWYNSYNTAAPYGQNDGALWQGN